MTVVDVIVVVIMITILIDRWSRLMMMGRRLISTTRPRGYAGLPIVVRGWQAGSRIIPRLFPYEQVRFSKCEPLNSVTREPKPQIRS